MRPCITLILILFHLAVFSQVGIGTTTPNARLEIKSSSQTSPSATDGQIIPKADNFSLEGPTEIHDGMLIFITGEGSVAKGFYSWDNDAGKWLRLSPSGLELLDEGNGPGWRLIGRGPAGFSSIGFNAVDLSFSNSSVGASGNYAMAVNFNTIALGLGSFAAGDGAFANGNYSFAAGAKSTALGNYSAAFNNHTLADAFASFAVGSFNVGGGNSTFWIAEDPIFEVGNGTNFSNRSNALTILKNGKILAPSLSNGEITDGKSLITKEYADANYDDSGIDPSGLVTITEDGDTGWRLEGKDPQFYEDIGMDAVDLSHSNQIPPIPPPGTATQEVGNGASGRYAFAAGRNTKSKGDYTFAANWLTSAGCTACTAFGYNNIGGGDQLNFSSDDPLFEVGNGSTTNKSNAFTILRKGYVGIGTNQPLYPLHITSSVNNLNTNPLHYLAASSGVGTNGSGWIYGIGVSGGVFSSVGFATGSDIRIKDIVGHSDGAKDLETLNQIQITDYTFKDHKKYGNKVTKKVIAQQVKRVYPNAVNLSPSYIPNIYRAANFRSLSETHAIISFDQKVNVKVDEEIMLIDGNNHEFYASIEKVNGSDVLIELGSALGNLEQVFVYGKKVDDFHNVDYDAISMLNVSATQELYKRIKDLERENKAIKDSFEERLTQLEALVLTKQD